MFLYFEFLGQFHYLIYSLSYKIYHLSSTSYIIVCSLYAILQVVFEASSCPLYEDSVLYQMNHIFKGLHSTASCGSFCPRTFWKTFQFLGEPVNPYVQQDAYEFYSDLTCQLDECLEVNFCQHNINQ